MPELFIGLMSGTSMDGVDAALARIDGQDLALLDTLACPLDPELHRAIHQLSSPGDNEIDRLGQLDRQLGRVFGNAANRLLSQAGIAPEQVRAIGSHGQTIRHRPPSAVADPNTAFTLQIGDPNTISEITGITTVADFRRRDMCAGGEGAPLAPAFHAAAFSADHCARAIVNIGGIANVSLLPARTITAVGTLAPVIGFDTGPGNTLMDQWIGRHRGERFDADGRWGAEGNLNENLLQALLQHPYLVQAAPKSTGKEMFNLPWLDLILKQHPGLDPRDVQACLAEFTARSIAAAIIGADESVGEVYICGGGAANGDLMRRLYQQLKPRTLATTAELGCEPDWVEAAAFAWLAHRTLQALPGNLPAVTGARGERILGAIYPGGR
jgi:anhydro-N-acetylmuramic acid kinase